MSTRIKVFLAGEGTNELGGLAGDSAYHDNKRPGVLHALLTRVQPEGWEVGGACIWKSIRKLRARGADHDDTRNVLGAALDAKEAGCDVLAFSRDRDNDHARIEAIKAGIQRALEQFENNPSIIGGVAVPTMEAWILALLDRTKTEKLSPTAAEKNLEALGHGVKNTAAMVRAVEEADLSHLPVDAHSLRAWLDQAQRLLPSP